MKDDNKSLDDSDSASPSLRTVLTGALEESPKVFSSIRLQMLLSFAFCAALPACVWAFVSLKEGKVVEFPMGASTFFVGIVAATSASKVVQYWKE